MPLITVAVELIGERKRKSRDISAGFRCQASTLSHSCEMEL